MSNKFKNNFVNKLLTIFIIIVVVIIIGFISYFYFNDDALIFQLSIYPAIIIGGIILIVGMVLISLLGQGLLYLLTEIMDMNNRLIRIERELKINNKQQNSRE